MTQQQPTPQWGALYTQQFMDDKWALASHGTGTTQTWDAQIADLDDAGNVVDWRHPTLSEITTGATSLIAHLAATINTLSGG